MKGLDFLKAVDQGNLRNVSSYLDDGIDPNVRDIIDRTTALHIAVEKSNLEMIRLLLQRGADASNCENDSQSSPLGIALISGNRDVVELLLKHKAKLSEAEIESSILDESRSLGFSELANLVQAASYDS